MENSTINKKEEINISLVGEDYFVLIAWKKDMNVIFIKVPQEVSDHFSEKPVSFLEVEENRVKCLDLFYEHVEVKGENWEIWEPVKRTKDGSFSVGKNKDIACHSFGMGYWGYSAGITYL